MVALRALEWVRGTPSIRLLRRVALAGILALLAAAAPAQASEATKIYERCAHGESLQGFKPSAYREALEQMPTIVREYYDYCEGLIHKAELAAAGGAGGSAGTGAPGASSNTPIPLTPAESKAVENAHSQGAGSVPVGGVPIRPGVVHADIASAVNKLPRSLLAMLALLVASALVLLAVEARKRVIARRNG